MRLSHAEAQALVSARLDGPLDPVAERELNAHLATCESCRAFNVSATQLARGLQGLPRLAPSPAVTRGVLEHVSAPRSGLMSLFGGLPQNALPIASAVAAAVIVLFVGAFGVLRLMDDDEPNVIPALTDPTSETNLAQQPKGTEFEEQTATVDVPGTEPGQETMVETPEGDVAARTGEDSGQEDVPTSSSDQPIATESQPSAGTGEVTEPAVATEAPEESGATEETSEAQSATEADDGSSRRLTIADTEATPEGGSTEPGEATSAAEPTEDLAEPTNQGAGEPETGSSPETEIGPSGQSTTRPEETREPSPTSEPTLEPSPAPSATTEPTPEPTATTEPTPEPTATTESTPTQIPIIQRETPVGDDVTAEVDDGTGAAITEEPVDDQPIEPSGQTEGSTETAPPSIEPADGDTIIGPPGDEGDGTDPELTPENGTEATADVAQPQGGESNTGMGSADVSLGTAPEVQDLGSIPGDQDASGARLGLDVNGQLIYATNPGRVSLERNGITLRGIDAELGQAVGACNANGECVDVSTASKGDAGGTDTPIGWIGDTAVYERILGDGSIEFRATTIDPATFESGQDVTLGEGPWDWETIVRPYPYGDGLLVPALNYWLYITSDGVTVVSGNPGQGDVSQFRVKPELGLIAYSTGGTILVAPLDAPGETISELPYDGFDYDLSPDGSQFAILTGDGIAIYDLNGNLVTTIPNPEGISVGSLTWVNDGIFFSDLTNGVLRVVQP